MRGLTYTELADHYGVDLCIGECGESGHDDGWYGGRRVHFRERGVTRSGLRLFLMLVHDAKDWQPLPTHRKLTNRLRWIHSRNSFAYFHALNVHGIRLPRALSARDRATVRYLITKVPSIDDHWVPAAVRSWSARG